MDKSEFGDVKTDTGSLLQMNKNNFSNFSE